MKDDIFLEIMKLISELDDNLIKKFFDFESEKNLDEKLRILKGLKSKEIKVGSDEYYSILELYDETSIWD